MHVVAHNIKHLLSVFPGMGNQNYDVDSGVLDQRDINSSQHSNSRPVSTCVETTSPYNIPRKNFFKLLKVIPSKRDRGAVVSRFVHFEEKKRVVCGNDPIRIFDSETCLQVGEIYRNKYGGCDVQDMIKLNEDTVLCKTRATLFYLRIFPSLHFDVVVTLPNLSTYAPPHPGFGRIFSLVNDLFLCIQHRRLMHVVDLKLERPEIVSSIKGIPFSDSDSDIVLSKKNSGSFYINPIDRSLGNTGKNMFINQVSYEKGILERLFKIGCEAYSLETYLDQEGDEILVFGTPREMYDVSKFPCSICFYNPSLPRKERKFRKIEVSEFPKSLLCIDGSFLCVGDSFGKIDVFKFDDNLKPWEEDYKLLTTGKVFDIPYESEKYPYRMKMKMDIFRINSRSKVDLIVSAEKEQVLKIISISGMSLSSGFFYGQNNREAIMLREDVNDRIGYLAGILDDENITGYTYSTLNFRDENMITMFKSFLE